MRTLYLRNVPDEVVVRLSRLAKLRGVSVNAVAVAELEESARRVSNADVLDGAPSFDVSMDQIVAALHEGRDER